MILSVTGCDAEPSAPGAAPTAAPAGQTGRTATEPTIQYWTCSMHPQIQQSHPGQCPICGMDLIPVSGSLQPVMKAKKVKHACAMMCIPPQDNPGKCPVCGMEMVAVEEGGEGDDRTTEITLSPTARRLAKVDVACVERRFVPAEIRLVGKVDFDETRLGVITSRVRGRLERLYVDYTGVPVAKGDHLVDLFSPDLLTAQEELIQALRSMKESAPTGIPALRDGAAENIRTVREKLLLWGLTPEQLDEIERRGSPSDHLTIFAPMGGVVIEKDAIEGMYVETGTRIYTIADLSTLWVKLNVYESDLAWIRYGQSVEFQTEAYPGQTFKGTIAFLDPILDEKTRTVKVRVNAPNTDRRLKPGMFVRAVVRSGLATGGKVMEPALAGKWICPMHPEIVKNDSGHCDECGMPLVTTESLGYVSSDPATARPPLAIPATAPLITGKRAIVYLEKTGQAGVYEGREVTLGPRAGDFYLVDSGLSEGERIVVRGALQIDSAMQILAKRSMMSPEAGAGPPTHARGETPPAGLAVPAMPGVEAPPAFKAQLDGVYAGLFATQDALSHDRLADAQAGAKKLGQALRVVDMNLVPPAARDAWLKEAEGLKKRAADLASAKDIDTARAAYEHVSNAMIAVAKKYGSSGKQTIRRYHCPMAFNNRGADWLQNKEGLENPYFGAAMFSCGVFKEIIEPGPAEPLKGGPSGE